MRLDETFESEYRAATEGALALDRSHLAAISVRGKDRESFLQNMLTNDVRSLPLFAGIPAAFLTVKGKLVSDMVVFREEDRFLLQMERERTAPLRKALDRYLISEDVALEILADQEAMFSLEGPEAASMLASLSDVSVAELDALPHLHFRLLPIAGFPARLTAQRRELTARFDISAAPAAVKAIFEEVLRSGAVAGGELVREARRLEASRPRFGVDMDESHLPQEAGLDEAISFQKGCYIGQEYVVRLAHRGHVNRKLMGLSIEGMTPAAPETPIEREGSTVGEVTSSAPSPAFGGALAFGYVRREQAEPGASAVVAGRRATLSALPFARP